MNLYTYAAFYTPTNDEGEIKKKECKVLIQPTTTLAESPDAVGIVAARELPDDVLDDLGNVNIVVRPF